MLYSFKGGTDGKNPNAGVIRDAAGNLYGTTLGGGAYAAFGGGVVYKLDPAGNETVLASLSGHLYGGIIRDPAGNLYGTTNGGGTFNAGTVFKLDTAEQMTVLYNFTGGADGSEPFAGLVRDPAGNLYGTTGLGGALNLGVVFKLDTSGNETVLHSFAGAPADGHRPTASLLLDSTGNLYGTTYLGGTMNQGIVFQLKP